MAPSGGCLDLVRINFGSLCLMWMFLATCSGAMTAKTSYYMDSTFDCTVMGFISVPRGQTTMVYARSNSNAGNALSCMLKFEPQTKGDYLRVSFQGGAYINSQDVELTVSMPGAGTYNYGSMSHSVPAPLELVNGKATINLNRKSFTRDFSFALLVKAGIPIEGGSDSDSKSTDVGLIVGIIAGIIAFLIIIAVICLFCLRKRKENRERNLKEMKQDLTKDSLNTSMGYDNSTVKSGRPADPSDDSPRSDRKLLVNEPPKSALDRFGPSPAQRRRPLGSRGDNYDDVESGRRRGDYEEREVRPRDDRPGYRDYDTGPAKDYENRDYSRRQNEMRNQGGPSRQEFEGRVRRPDEEVDPRRSPLLDDLQRNPKFRQSLHDANQGPDTREFRRQAPDDSISSSVSVDSNGVSMRPKLPPVPKSPPRSPSPQRRGEKIAGIFRARPSSSGSEIARVGEENGTNDDSLSEAGGGHVSRRDVAEAKGEVKHTLRPNRGERQTQRRNMAEVEAEDSAEEDRRRRKEEKKRKAQRARRNTEEEEDDEDVEDKRRKRREKDRREEERARRRQQEEEEEEEEERRRMKEHERKKRKEEERIRQEEEEEKAKRKRRKEKEKEKEEERYEGRFKKSASGRRSKGKAPRMGRSRSTGNALEEMETQYQRSRSKSPSSVRSLNFIEDDDDDDVDSNYMPFRRAGSKASLYTSRTSLTGRRRKNSMGETMSLSSYARVDDTDSRMGDFRGSNMSHREKERLFRSTGDLDMRPASAEIVRDCSTQTGVERAVHIYGKRTMARGRMGKRFSRGTQTMGRERRDSTGSAKSGRSTRSNRLKSKSKSQESLRHQKRSRSKNFDDSDDDESERSRRTGRSKSRDRDYSDDDAGTRKRKHKSRSRENLSESSRSKPRTRPRKSTGTASVDLSDSDDDFDDSRSGVTSSVAPSSVYAPTYQPAYGPAMIPAGYPAAGYPVAYPQPGVAYLPSAPGGPPMMMGAVAQPPNSRPPVAPKPRNQSKWDQLVQMTDGEHRQRQYPDSIAETESVFTSALGEGASPRGAQAVYAPPSYISAQRLPDPNVTYSSSYPNSSGEGRTPRDYKLSGSIYTDSVV